MIVEIYLTKQARPWIFLKISFTSLVFFNDTPFRTPRTALPLNTRSDRKLVYETGRSKCKGGIFCPEHVPHRTQYRRGLRFAAAGRSTEKRPIKEMEEMSVLTMVSL
uniref:GcrA cell cycle regulator n=1 Tax=Steinernema glaseri TaxID=37863 RepID=A0A1I7YV83_9BILA